MKNEKEIYEVNGENITLDVNAFDKIYKKGEEVVCYITVNDRRDNIMNLDCEVVGDLESSGIINIQVTPDHAEGNQTVYKVRFTPTKSVTNGKLTLHFSYMKERDKKIHENEEVILNVSDEEYSKKLTSGAMTLDITPLTKILKKNETLILGVFGIFSSKILIPLF